MRDANAAPRAEGVVPLSRRTLLRHAVVASGALLAPAGFATAAEAWRVPSKRRVMWGLSAAAEHGASCGGCRACTAHAHNKLFASAAAADRGRAHPGCGCTVVRAGSIPVTTWRALFVRSDGSRRASVDRRTPRVRRLLRPAHRTVVG